MNQYDFVVIRFVVGHAAVCEVRIAGRGGGYECVCLLSSILRLFVIMALRLWHILCSHQLR